MAYQQPMVTVDQNVTITPTSIERDMPAFVFGPNYELHRFTDAQEKPKTKIGTWTGSGMSAFYPDVADSNKVDESYTKLYGDNVLVHLATLQAPALPELNVPDADVEANGGYTKLLFENKKYYDKDGGTLDTPVKANLKVGDILLVSYTQAGSAQKVETYIKEVKYSAEGWSIDSSSSPEGEPGTLVTIADPIPTTGLTTGSIAVDLVMKLQGVEFPRKNLSGEGEAWQWEQPEDGVTVDGKTDRGVAVNVLKIDIDPYDVAGYSDVGEAGTWERVLKADLYVTTRELVTSYSDTIHSVLSSAGVAALLGTVSPDNPLAMGVYMATLNAATDDGDEAPPVYFMAVPTDDVDGYDRVLARAELTDKVYYMAPTTRDDAVIEKLMAHVNAMSAKTVKQWRMAIASAEVKDGTMVLSSASNPSGKDYYAIPVADGADGTKATSASKFNKIRVTKSASSVDGNSDTDFVADVKAGDIVRFNFNPSNEWGEVGFKEYEVSRVVNGFTVEIAEKDAPISTNMLDNDGAGGFKPSKVEIYHPYTAGEQADAIASASRKMASRRTLNVFPPEFVNNGVKMSGEFAACAIAGLASATEPQQPITNMPVRGIDEIPITYLMYNRAQLNDIAAGGTFIVCQDLPGDRVYIRHQITTAYSEGNLNTAEMSITKNVDSISYAFAQVFAPYVGRYNITPDLLAIFKNLSMQLISQFTASTSVYGPQLIADETTILYIRQNELMKDHVDIGIRLGVPYPCNNIDIVLTI